MVHMIIHASHDFVSGALN